MKAIAVHPENREFGIVDVERPRLASPTQVRVRILDVGVCGTDKEICAFEYGTPPDGSTHLVIGHETVGEIVEAGRDVRRVSVGDLVVPSVRRVCGRPECTACGAGRQDFCFTGGFSERGIKGQHGFMTEEIVDDESHMHVVPRSLRDVAVLVEPLTIAQKAVKQLHQVQLRLPWQCPKMAGHRTDGHACHRALVLGAGPVGLLGAMTLRNAGFETFVYSRERAPSPKAALVESIGGRYLSSEEVPTSRLAERIGNIDVVYEAVGASKLAFDVMGELGTNGAFIFTGVPGRRGPTEVDTDGLMRSLVLRNQMVLGTVNAGFETFEDAIADLKAFSERWPSAVRALITGRFPLDAHRELLEGKRGGIKNVLAFA